MARRDTISVPFSKMKLAVAELLSTKGFVGAVSQKMKGTTPRYLNVDVLYEADGSPKIRDVNRISKPSRRLYEKSKNIKPYRRGVGISVLSTPNGIMADMDAKKANLGGELLFTIW